MYIFSPSQILKLKILAEGITVTNRAQQWLLEHANIAKLSSADYASTSGVVLKLEGDVWVNAPLQEYNPNFVDAPTSVLDVIDDGLYVSNGNLEARAWYCLQPAYHSSEELADLPKHIVVTHGDRVRLSPMTGCSYSCQFCDIPFSGIDYSLHPVDVCIKALKTAAADCIQPAQHIMISGGTPRESDAESHRALYREILASFQDLPVDIMMVPLSNVFDIDELGKLGINELSINLELHDEARAKKLAPQKYQFGARHYLDFIEKAIERLGRGRVRSMLLVGLEPLESTLAGVKAIAERGAVPVLSPFRPDPSTPLRDLRPPSYELMYEAYLRAQEIAVGYGVPLGPKCPPCTHNTLSFGTDSHGNVVYPYSQPALL
ncbi:MAG: radical SAM protein [Coriobacteriales bacterium]|nr:radical SAM protein [Coriobacteriales bacterium]